MPNQLSAIDHIVVLALENRSFDQMLGFLYTAQGNVSPAGQPYEGLKGTETNPDKNGDQVAVFTIQPADPLAYFMPGCDPGEAYPQVNQQLFGTLDPPDPPVATNQGFLINFANNLPGREANTKYFGAWPGTVPNNIMGMYPPEMLPVISGLARGYAVCDHWFASVPSETMPNRAFMCAGTCQGKMGDSNVTPYTAPSIFGALAKAGVSWMAYGYDRLPDCMTDFTDVKQGYDNHFATFADFQAAAAGGTLPSFSFLEPSWGPSGNSQHPRYNVALGEQMIHDVYYALRNGPGWNQTLFILVYDEHGGNFDHVPPPMGATPPDTTTVGDKNFDFKRFGVRVPAVLISPLIAPGTVFRAPDGTTPLDHTSILKTVERRFGLVPLTNRDAAASDIGDVLTLAAPRIDDPLTGVVAPTAVAPGPDTVPSQLQRVQAATVEQLTVPDAQGRTDHEMPPLTTSADFDNYISTRTKAWRASKRARGLAVFKRPRARSKAARATAAPAGPGPRQVVILRHGEKPADPRNPDLSPAGELRADMLAKAIPQIFPNPDLLFAAAPSRNSNRPVETLTPLARALTMPLHADISETGYAALAADLLQTADYAGKLAIVCWHHGDIPDLALALGVPKDQMNDRLGMEGMHWDASRFDLFWSIVFPGGQPTLTISQQPPVAG